MRKIVLLILITINFAAMAQNKQDKILFNQQMDFFVDKNEYVKAVTIFSPVMMYPFHMSNKEFQERDIKFTMVYNLVKETKTSQTVTTITAYFAGDGANYKIYESGYLSGWMYREYEDQPWEQMSYEARLDKSEYVGDSNNKELLTVKIWEYVQQHWKY